MRGGTGQPKLASLDDPSYGVEALEISLAQSRPERPRPNMLPAPVDNPDIFQAAKLIIDQHGEEAWIFAARRADDLLDEDGDLEGSAVWHFAAKHRLRASPPRLCAQPKLFSQPAPLPSVVRCDHRIIERQVPTLSVFFDRHLMGSPKVSF